MTEQEPYSPPSSLIALATDQSWDISKSLEQTTGGFLTYRQKIVFHFGENSQAISAGELSRFLGQLRPMAMDSAVPAPPRKRAFSLAGAGQKLIEFIELFFDQIRSIICKGKAGSVGSATVLAELANWLATHAGVETFLSHGAATAILLTVLVATKGAFCEMTKDEAKKALKAAKAPTKK